MQFKRATKSIPEPVSSNALAVRRAINKVLKKHHRTKTTSSAPPPLAAPSLRPSQTSPILHAMQPTTALRTTLQLRKRPKKGRSRALPHNDLSNEPVVGFGPAEASAAAAIAQATAAATAVAYPDHAAQAEQHAARLQKRLAEARPAHGVDAGAGAGDGGEAPFNDPTDPGGGNTDNTGYPKFNPYYQEQLHQERRANRGLPPIQLRLKDGQPPKHYKRLSRHNLLSLNSSSSGSGSSGSGGYRSEDGSPSDLVSLWIGRIDVGTPTHAHHHHQQEGGPEQQPLLTIASLSTTAGADAFKTATAARTSAAAAAATKDTGFTWPRSISSTSSDHATAENMAYDADGSHDEGGGGDGAAATAAVGGGGGVDVRSSPVLQSTNLDDSRRIEISAEPDEQRQHQQQQQQQQQIEEAKEEEAAIFDELERALKSLPLPHGGIGGASAAETDAASVEPPPQPQQRQSEREGRAAPPTSPGMKIVSPSRGVYRVDVVVPGSAGAPAAAAAAAQEATAAASASAAAAARPLHTILPIISVTEPETEGGIDLSLKDSLARINNGGTPFVYAPSNPRNASINSDDAPNSAGHRAEEHHAGIQNAAVRKAVAEASPHQHEDHDHGITTTAAAANTAATALPPAAAAAAMATLETPAGPPPTPAARAVRPQLPDPTKSRRIADIATIGHYEVGAKIGDGSFSVVKQGRHVITGQMVALKLVDKTAVKTVDNVYLIKHLHREADILRSLNHRNIVKLLEVIETADVLCLVLELAAVDMYEHLGIVRKLPEKKVLTYARQLLSAVTYLHTHNVVHRDIKAENLMLDCNSDLMLVDFGLSNVFADAAGLLSTNCGSLAYSAPELLTCEQYGTEVDIWSVGVCIYAMATGILPFGNVENVNELHARMLAQDYVLPSHLSDELKDVFNRIFVKQEKRITVDELWQHPWFTGATASLTPDDGLTAAVRNAKGEPDITEDSIDVTLVDQIVRMSRNQNSSSSLKATKAAVVRSIVDQRCDSSCATYHLMISKHKRTITQRKRAEQTGGSKHGKGKGKGKSKCKGSSASKYAKVNGVVSSSGGRDTISMHRPRPREGVKQRKVSFGELSPTSRSTPSP